MKFIDGRLDILNEDKVPDDLFEEEILKCETAGGAFVRPCICVSVCDITHLPHVLLCFCRFVGRSKSYQQLVGNLKVSSFFLTPMKQEVSVKRSNTKSPVPFAERGRSADPEHEVQSKHEGECQPRCFYWVVGQHYQNASIHDD